MEMLHRSAGYAGVGNLKVSMFVTRDDQIRVERSQRAIREIVFAFNQTQLEGIYDTTSSVRPRLAYIRHLFLPTFAILSSLSLFLHSNHGLTCMGFLSEDAEGVSSELSFAVFDSADMVPSDTHCLHKWRQASPTALGEGEVLTRWDPLYRWRRWLQRRFYSTTSCRRLADKS
jgi:hypothetical protein